MIDSGAAQTQLRRTDFQFWNETQLIKKLSKNKDLVIIGVLRFGRDNFRPVDERIGASLVFKVHPNISIAPTYIHVEQQPNPVLRIQEERLVMNVTGKVSVRKFTFTDRNLFERRVRHNMRDFTVYRNRLQVDYPLKWGDFEFKPFVANEAWYSSQTGAAGRFGWFRNRVSAGIIKQFTQNFTGEFFYLYQMDGLSRPGNVGVIGTVFKYNF